MKPITAEERRSWGLELELASVRPASERHHDKNGVRVERIFAPYVAGLDLPEVKLLAIECLRRLLRGCSRDRKIELMAWIAQAARSLASEDAERIAALANARRQSTKKAWETRKS